jgi:urea transporter/murein DD-endopeptidase MepM/ murein hydrolase activator NlpD
VILAREHDARRDNVGSRLKQFVAGFLSAYSGILFVDHPFVGLVFLAATFWFPNVGLAGLIGAAVGLTIGFVLRLPYASSGANVYSSLLVGLSLGAYYLLTAHLVLLILLSAALTVLLAAVLRDFLWRLGHLPVLSVPFVLVALTAALAAGTYGGLVPYYAPSQLPPALFVSPVDSFFTALGSTFFSPHPLVGALLFLGISARSPYLAFLCATGFASGAAVFSTLAVDPAIGLLEWTGFNFSLTAMAVGGIFAVPSLAAFVLAMLAAGAAAVVTGALSQLLLVYSLPVMASPFLLTTLTLLAALRLRLSVAPPHLLLENPSLPENNYERARLAKSRLGSLGSVPLMPPFLGEWQVYQGFDGEHTHRQRWRFAVDFFRLENERSYANDGTHLENFHCFGLPVLSPVYGVVHAIEEALPDNLPGQLDLRNNWGNHVLIRTDGGLFVLLAHLKQFSVKVKAGERVSPSTPIASCGNSGRSPQPHLHLQVQRHGGLGGTTLPFHLVSTIVRAQSQPSEFRLVTAGAVGDSVQRAAEDRRLAHALQLPVGRSLQYRVEDRTSRTSLRTLTIKVTLLGQLRVVSDKGASAAFEVSSGTIGFYDRHGPADLFLDAWLLALGLTPTSDLATAWIDAPSARLMQLPLRLRIWRRVCHPLGLGLASRYEREFDQSTSLFAQHGEHALKLPGMRKLVASTRALLGADHGCVQFELDGPAGGLRARLVGVAQRSDRGVPAWEYALDGPAVPEQ